MQIGDTNLYRWMVVFKSRGECPYNEFLLGSEMSDRERVFHWLTEDYERKTEIKECKAIAVVEMPDWMTAEEARAWVQARPRVLEPFFDDEWYRHMDMLDQHFGGTAWREAKQIRMTDGI